MNAEQYQVIYLWRRDSSNDMFCVASPQIAATDGGFVNVMTINIHVQRNPCLNNGTGTKQLYLSIYCHLVLIKLMCHVLL